MTELLTEKLLTLQQAQETLAMDFREIKAERDLALAGEHAFPRSSIARRHAMLQVSKPGFRSHFRAPDREPSVFK
jgi:hypothetical protein